MPKKSNMKQNFIPTPTHLKEILHALDAFIQAEDEWERVQRMQATTDRLQAIIAALHRLRRSVEPLGTGMIIAQGWTPNMDLSQALTATASMAPKLFEGQKIRVIKGGGDEEVRSNDLISLDKLGLKPNDRGTLQQAAIWMYEALRRIEG